MLIFVHIPKTAGGSLISIISSQYDSHEIFRMGFPEQNTAAKINHNIKCVLGHTFYGQHEELAPHIYVTMLRDPVERVISHYYYAKDILKSEKVERYSLEEFAQSGWYANMQTRYITGGKPELEKAINHLKTFGFFGITEMFAESVFLMKKTLGWEDIHYSAVNVNTGRPKKETIPKETVEIIKKANHLDIQLYQWAKKDFEDRLSALDNKLRNELEDWMKSLKL